MASLGDTYQIEINVTSKPKDEFETDEYFALDLTVAPAVMVGDEIVVEGSDVSDYQLQSCTCRQLGLPEPDQPQKGVLDRLLNT